MSKGNLIYQGKIKLIALSKEFVMKEDYGYDTKCLKNKIMYIKSLITTLERWITPDSTNRIEGDYLYLQGKKILLSQNNNYICTTEDQTINVDDTFLNCLTEEEVCKAALKLQIIIHQ